VEWGVKLYSNQPTKTVHSARWIPDIIQASQRMPLRGHTYMNAQMNGQPENNASGPIMQFDLLFAATKLTTQ